LSARFVSLALLTSLIGCGYRPVAGTLPGGLKSVQVAVPEPGATGEPELARILAVELVRQLGRAGIAASAARGGRGVLSTRLVALETADSPLDPTLSRVAGRVLRLRLELRLADRADATLWRSGILEVDELWALSPAGATASERSRRSSLQRLAARAAERAAELLTSGL